MDVAKVSTTVKVIQFIDGLVCPQRGFLRSVNMQVKQGVKQSKKSLRHAFRSQQIVTSVSVTPLNNAGICKNVTKETRDYLTLCKEKTSSYDGKSNVVSI